VCVQIVPNQKKRISRPSAVLPMAAGGNLGWGIGDPRQSEGMASALSNFVE